MSNGSSPYASPEKSQSTHSRMSYGSGFPNGAIQYHDVDLDILNLENADCGNEGSSNSFRPMSNASNDESHCSPGNDEEDIVLSKDGILCDNTISKGLSELCKTADGLSYAYLNLNITAFELVNVDLLAEFHHLQKVDLSHNKLTSLTVLQYLPNLIELNASHNQLTCLLDFKPPKNLCIADFSDNQLTTIGDLSAHKGLQKLFINSNAIQVIDGLSNCHKLRHLSLNHNKVDVISGLGDLPIQTLELAYNDITTLTGIEKLQLLQNIDLGGNKIRSLKGLEKHEVLTSINLEENEIIDISELQHLQKLRILRFLNLMNCPVQEVTDYRLMVLYQLPFLLELDRHRVEVSEKVQAKNIFNPAMEVSAERDHRLNMVYSFFQPHCVLDSTLQSAETPYPMLILAGPQGSGKKELALKLTQEFPDFFGYGISHTTRKPYVGEESGRDYHFVSLEDFEALQMKGKFIQTNLFQGHLYGFTLDALESVAREGLACVVHMELEGVLATKLTYLEPRYVLTMPLDKHQHEKNLRQKGVYQDAQIAHSLQRAEKYAVYNQDHPGFFDMVINSNDVMEAYIRLRRLVMDYLGLSSSPDGGARTEQIGSNSGGGVKLETRTWSKASVPISASQLLSGAAARRGDKSAPGLSGDTLSGAGRGLIEQESLKRRHSEVRTTLSGVRTSAVEEALKASPLSSRERTHADAINGTDQALHERKSTGRSTATRSDNSRLSEVRMNGSTKGDELYMAGDLDTGRQGGQSAPLPLDLMSSGGSNSNRIGSGALAAPRPLSGSAAGRKVLPPLTNGADKTDGPTPPLGQARWESPREILPEN